MTIHASEIGQRLGTQICRGLVSDATIAVSQYVRAADLSLTHKMTLKYLIFPALQATDQYLTRKRRYDTSRPDGKTTFLISEATPQYQKYWTEKAKDTQSTAVCSTFTNPSTARFFIRLYRDPYWKLPSNTKMRQTYIVKNGNFAEAISASQN